MYSNQTVYSRENNYALLLIYMGVFVYHTHTLGIQNTFGYAAYLGILCIIWAHNFHLVWFGIDILGVHFSFKV